MDFFRGLKGKIFERIPQTPSSTHNSPSQFSSSDNSSTALAKRTFDYFYSPRNQQFEAPVQSDGTLGPNDHFGYTVWSVIITVQATVECLPPQDIVVAIQTLQQYWHPQRHGFCAWKYFPGNEDVYYDDNCHAVQALVSAYERMHHQPYLEQAKEILFGLIIPPSEEEGPGRGGVPWRVSDHISRNACSTGPAAVGALRIHLHERNERLLSFAKRALSWLVENLQDPEDHLIYDGGKFYTDGRPAEIEKMKWTYNTGFAIHGFTLLYEATGDQGNLQTAVKMAQSAMNPTHWFFDRDIPDHTLRFYRDGSFFLHHLVDGYVALQRHALKDELRGEIVRIARYGKDWFFDENDGLCFRGCEPWKVSEELTERYNTKTGMSRKFDMSKDERDENGRLCKTLIGCAGWTRIFYLDERLRGS
jgi:hypothetical protein